VIVAPRPFFSGSPGWCAVERLELGLLIETEHHGMGWRRRDIQAHDVMQLIDEGGVLQQFEDAPAMWT
jgi:hypothetical protein